jgi:hypothetical protein
MIEQLDPRQILDAPLALASDGLILADPSLDELLEPAAVELPSTPDNTSTAPPILGSTSTSQKTATSAELPVTMTESCGGTGGVATLSVSISGGIAEAPALGDSTAVIHFEAHGCGVPPPYSMTVSFDLGGTAEEGDGKDYTAPELRSNTLTIPMTDIGGGNSLGTKDVYLNALDDDIDEPIFESIELFGIFATTEPASNATFVTPDSVSTTVASGDYTHKLFTYSPSLQKHIENASGETWIAVQQDMTIGIQLWHGGNQKPGVKVTLKRQGADEGTDARIVTADGLKDEAEATTGQNDATAWFTVRGLLSSGRDTTGHAGKARFYAEWRNAEGRPQGRTITFEVVPANE